MQPRVFLGVHSLGLDRGGIARVARLTARVLGEECAAGRVQARGISLLESTRSYGVEARTPQKSQTPAQNCSISPTDHSHSSV